MSAAAQLPVLTVVWETAVGTSVTATVGGLVAWLAHRRGWLARPAAALAGWLQHEAPAISDEVVKLIADELERRAQTPPAAPAPASEEPPPVQVAADPGMASPLTAGSWSPPDWDPKAGDPTPRAG